MTDTSNNAILKKLFEGDICQEKTIEFITDTLDPIVEILLNKDIEISNSEISQYGGALAINAPFGMGKSFFCKRYSEYLNEKAFKEKKCSSTIVNLCLYDYHAEPLLIINDTLRRLCTKEDKAMGEVLFNAIKLVLKAGRRIVPEFDVLSEVIDEFSKQSLKQAIESYKSALSQLAKNTPIVIFIDELDRCKPDFALLFLERLKHYFDDIPNLLFILMINEQRLAEIIKHTYGTEKPNEYLEKFLCHNIIDLHTTNYETVSVTKTLEYSILRKLLDNIYGKYHANARLNIDEFIQKLACSAKIMQLNLRELVKLSNQMNGKIENKTLDAADLHYIKSYFTPYFLTLIVKYPKIARDLRAGVPTAYKTACKSLEELAEVMSILPQPHALTLKDRILIFLKAASGDSDAIKNAKELEGTPLLQYQQTNEEYVQSISLILKSIVETCCK